MLKISLFQGLDFQTVGSGNIKKSSSKMSKIIIEKLILFTGNYRLIMALNYVTEP